MTSSNHHSSNSATSDIPQWIPNTGKTSFVWKYFQAKTNGRAYCRKIDKAATGHGNECGYNCAYKSQTSSMLYHIHNFHKQFEKKLEVSKGLKII